MAIDEKTEKIQQELEICKERADFCLRNDMSYIDEANEIYLRLADIFFQRNISDELKIQANQIAKQLSTKYGSFI